MIKTVLHSDMLSPGQREMDVLEILASSKEAI